MKKKTNNQKISIIQIISLSLIGLLTISNIILWITLIDTKKDLKNVSGTSNDISEFTKIMPSEIEEQSENSTIVAMIGRIDCGWCQRFEPILKSAAKKYNFNPKYIDMYKIVDSNSWEITNVDEYNTLMELDAVDEFKDFMSENFGSTPITLIIKNNTIVYAFSGYVEDETLSSILESNGFKA